MLRCLDSGAVTPLGVPARYKKMRGPKAPQMLHVALSDYGQKGSMNLAEAGDGPLMPVPVRTGRALSAGPGCTFTVWLWATT